MVDSNSIDSLELSPIRKEQLGGDLEYICYVINSLIKLYGSESMAFTAIDLSCKRGMGISFNELFQELVNQRIVSDHDTDKIEAVFNQIDEDKNGFLSSEEWRAAFEIYPARLEHLYAQSESHNSELINIIDENNTPYSEFNEIIDPKDSKHNHLHKYHLEVQQRNIAPQGLNGLMRKFNTYQLQTSSNKNHQQQDQSLSRRSKIGLLLPSASVLNVSSNQVESIFGESSKNPSKNNTRHTSTHNQLKPSDLKAVDVHLTNHKFPDQIFQSSSDEFDPNEQLRIVSEPVSSHQINIQQQGYTNQVSNQEQQQQQGVPQYQDNRMILEKKIINPGSKQEQLEKYHVFLFHENQKSPQRYTNSRFGQHTMQPQHFSSITNNQGFTLSNSNRFQRKSTAPTHMKTDFQNYLLKIGLGASKTNDKNEGGNRNLSPNFYRISSIERQNNTYKRTSQLTLSTLQQQQSSLNSNRQGLDNIINKINTKKGSLFLNHREGGGAVGIGGTSFQTTSNTQAHNNNIIQLHLQGNQIKPIEIDGSLEKIRLISVMRRPTTTTQPDIQQKIPAQIYHQPHFISNIGSNQSPIKSMRRSPEPGYIRQANYAFSQKLKFPSKTQRGHISSHSPDFHPQ